ncbi:Cupredoxin [Mycena polygramma]|nr:Cupredoxin [Mycena polygramma]
MHFSALASLAALVSVAAAADIQVQVGANGTTYTPNSVTAAQGDNIVFQFVAGNHSVTQSSFAAPCTYLSPSGVDSGFQLVAAGATQVPQWSFTVNNASAPLWFFCAQTTHCQKGMVFSVNAPTTGKTFASFQTAAMATTSSVPGPGNVTASSSGSASGSASAAGASGSAAPAGSGALMTRASMVLVGAGVVAGLFM